MIDDFQVKAVQTVIWVRRGREGAENEPQNKVLRTLRKQPSI